MSGYNEQDGTYTLTISKVEYWHRSIEHEGKDWCPLCHALERDSMFSILGRLRAAELDIKRVGRRFIVLACENRAKMNRIYEAVTGRASKFDDAGDPKVAPADDDVGF